MSLHYSERLKREIRARRGTAPHGRSQQFGQPNSSLTTNGATGCTDTILQWLIWRTKGKWVSQNRIRNVAGIYRIVYGANGERRGLRPDEVQRVLTYYQLPYKIVRGWSALQVARASRLGLVGFGHMYPWWPEWRGYRYGNVRADGHPNGYATPTGHAGRTQLSGFYGRHFGMLFGYATSPTEPDLYYGWEPNHGSAVRPERPPYDRMTFTQFARAYDSYQKVGGQTRYAIVHKDARQ